MCIINNGESWYKKIFSSAEYWRDFICDILLKKSIIVSRILKRPPAQKLENFLRKLEAVAVLETGVSRYHGCWIEGPLRTPLEYHSSMVPRGLREPPIMPRGGRFWNSRCRFSAHPPPGHRYTRTEKTFFTLKLNGIWSWWQFSFRFWTKLNSIWFKIERKTVITIISHSIWKEMEI